MAQPLFHTDLEGVIVGNSFRFPEVRIRVVAYEGHTESGISVRSRELGDGGGYLLSLQNALASIGVCRLVAVRKNLAIDRICGCGDSGLVKWDGEKFVLSVVANVADVDEQGIDGLPLNIEGPILRIRKCISGIVTAEEKSESRVSRRCTGGRNDDTTAQTRLIVNEGLNAGEIAGRRRRRRGAEGIVAEAVNAGTRAVEG